MLSRRLFQQLHPQPFLRAFGTSSICHRTPSLADITPNGAPQFDNRQAAFREQVKEAQREKEKLDSQSVITSKSSVSPSTSVSRRAPTASQSDASLAAHSQDDLGLGSLSTHDAGAAREASYKQEDRTRKGPLSSLIYGTREGRQMDQEIERSFSQVLARGKYVHSIVFHTVKPDKVDDYVDLVGGWYPKMANIKENHVNLVGSWRTEVGDCDTFSKSASIDIFSKDAEYEQQFISGSTNVIKVIMRLYTPLPLILNFRPLIRNLRPLSHTNRLRSCRNSLSGQQRPHDISEESSSSALIHYILETYSNGKLIGDGD